MKDGLQNVSFDRVLMRIRDVLYIVVTIGGIFWATIQIVRYMDRINQNITMLQQRVDILQQSINRK